MFQIKMYPSVHFLVFVVFVMVVSSQPDRAQERDLTIQDMAIKGFRVKRVADDSAGTSRSAETLVMRDVVDDLVGTPGFEETMKRRDVVEPAQPVIKQGSTVVKTRQVVKEKDVGAR